MLVSDSHDTNKNAIHLFSYYSRFKNKLTEIKSKKCEYITVGLLTLLRSRKNFQGRVKKPQTSRKLFIAEEHWRISGFAAPQWTFFFRFNFHVSPCFIKWKVVMWCTGKTDWNECGSLEFLSLCSSSSS